MRSRRLIWLAACFLLLEVGVLVDGFLIEPYWIEVTHHTVHAGTPAFGTAPLKIAHLTDLHTTGVGRLERQLLARIAAERPDAIVITGDSLAGFTGTYDEVRELFQQFHAPLGVWVVRGNRENGRPVHHERAFYDSTGVHFLLNQAEPVRPGVWMVGLDDAPSGNPDLSAALRYVPPGAYTVCLFHAPAYFDVMAGRVPLVLAGHSHGGQIIIPFVRPFWLPRGCGRFLAGWYEERGSRMYVSRGIGTTFLPMRFLCRPELAIITIEP